MKIETKYLGNMRFSSGDGVAAVTMDAKEPAGGMAEALSPKEMVLQGLAGCTGMDVAAILNKKKVSYDAFTIEVEAEKTKSHPQVFKHIKLTYRFKGNPEDKPHMERAVELSKNQFCGVSAMLAKTAEIEAEVIVEG